MAPLRARSMLFTLYGDYAFPSGRDVRFGGLVEIGGALGISEVAVRSAVARLAGEGWLTARRDGYRSRYGLSAAGRTLIVEGTARIYTPRVAEWSGTWTILNYSIPEAKRDVRDRIRKRLAWLGFGAMGGGAYVSPRDAVSGVQALIDEHGIADYARVFRGALAGPGSDLDLVARCWDLPAIAKRYDAFVAHYTRTKPGLAGEKTRRAANADVECFVTRFSLTHDFRRFPFIDPGLPDRLLPAKWPGRRAERLFQTMHGQLRDGALRYFERVAGDA
jgi:phenylacetic acid degradation operon negative regulatory protein